jgi:single-strand DNA-binding protein
MAGVNRVILIGNLGKDPEIRNLEGGAKVANFPLATTESYKNKNGERVESTEWHNIVLWRGLADVSERFLKKGNSVYIEGKLKTRSWEDQQGNKRYITEVIADNMTMLGGRKDDNGGASAEKKEENEEEVNPPDPSEVSDDVSDDLPF